MSSVVVLSEVKNRYWYIQQERLDKSRLPSPIPYTPTLKRRVYYQGLFLYLVEQRTHWRIVRRSNNAPINTQVFLLIGLITLIVFKLFFLEITVLYLIHY